MDPLDWTHQWDEYEMMLYAQAGAASGVHSVVLPDDAKVEAGIYMEVSQRIQRDGAEEWAVLYHRKLSSLIQTDSLYEPGTPEWEDAVLRCFLHQHPHLVDEEKSFLERFNSDRKNAGVEKFHE